MEKLIEEIKKLSADEWYEIAQKLKDHPTFVLAFKAGGDTPTCPQGEHWNGSACVPNV